MDSFVPFSVCLALCLSVVAFAYAGYPVVAFVCSRLFGRKPDAPSVAEDDLPFVSLLIAARNEDKWIGKRLENALTLEYPLDRFEIVIASDGSTDRTASLVRAVEARYPGLVRLLDYPEHRGKSAVLKDAVPLLRGEVVVLSDANTFMKPDAVRRLVEWFAQPDVGVVCGKLVLVDAATGQNADGLYWKYETFLKTCESRLGALLGSNGAIYAVRKRLFPTVPPDTIIDDFYIPLEARRRSGCRIVYDTRAVATEQTAPDVAAEFRRRARIGAGGFQSIGLLWPLLSPAHGWIAASFFCHKVIRWVCPFFLLAALALNAAILHTSAGQVMMVAQLAFYLTAVLGRRITARSRLTRFLKLPAMFVYMNAALFVGFFRWLLGRQKGTWERTDRELETAATIETLESEALPAAFSTPRAVAILDDEPSLSEVKA